MQKKENDLTKFKEYLRFCSLRVWGKEYYNKLKVHELKLVI